MEYLVWFVLAVLFVVLATFAIFYVIARCFFQNIIIRNPDLKMENDLSINKEPDRQLDLIRERNEWFRAQNVKEIFINSQDNLRLHGTLLQCDSNSNCVICFHGYTSEGQSDYGPIAKFYNEQNFNVLMTDARAHGGSEGEYAGFGVLDRNDALNWIDYAIGYFGKGVNILLHGISMGSATVLMASGLALPKNVRAIIADCGFTSVFDEFSHILKRDFHVPRFPILNITEFMTRRYAGYGYNDVKTFDEVAKTNIPILFIHGDKDDFVPVWMSKKNYEACKSDKALLIVKGAEHGRSYYVDTPAYENAVKAMIKKYVH